jgi:hypothetical protein
MNVLAIFDYIDAQPVFVAIPLLVICAYPVGMYLLFVTPETRPFMLGALAGSCCLLFSVATWEAMSEGVDNRAALRRGFAVVIGTLMLIPVVTYPWAIRMIAPVDCRERLLGIKLFRKLSRRDNVRRL